MKCACVCAKLHQAVVYACVCACACALVHTCVCVCVCVCVWLGEYTCIYIYIYICMHACSYLCLSTYITKLEKNYRIIEINKSKQCIPPPEPERSKITWHQVMIMVTRTLVVFRLV